MAYAKILTYETVLSLLPYDSETWPLKEVHEQKLTVFEVSLLRGIYGVKRKCLIDRKYSTVDTDMEANVAGQY